MTTMAITMKVLQWSYKRILLTVLVVVTVFLLLFAYQSDVYAIAMTEPKVRVQRAVRAKCCLNRHSDLIPMDMCGRTECLQFCPLSDPSLYAHLMKNGNNKAFFLETSGRPTLKYRQACAIESLARLNPNTSVHLLMTSQNIDYDSPVIKTLLANFPSNFDVTSIDVGDYITDTPLEQWYFCTTWNYGPYPVVHLSDALRLLTLFKFGGYYFDLDVIQIRPVESYRNFIATEDRVKVANAVFHFDRGHPLLRLAIEEFHTHYRRNSWAYNGPDLLDRLLKTIWCSVDDIPTMNRDTCRGFDVLRPRAFHPIHHGTEWIGGIFGSSEYFRSRAPDELLHWFGDQDPTIIAAHTWNSLNGHLTADKNSNQFYVQLARSQCPLIYEILPEKF